MYKYSTIKWQTSSHLFVWMELCSAVSSILNYSWISSLIFFVILFETCLLYKIICTYSFIMPAHPRFLFTYFSATEQLKNEHHKSDVWQAFRTCQAFPTGSGQKAWHCRWRSHASNCSSLYYYNKFTHVSKLQWVMLFLIVLDFSKSWSNEIIHL